MYHTTLQDTFFMKMGNFVVKEIGLCSEQLQFSKTKCREGQTKIDNKHVIKAVNLFINTN